MGLAGLDWARLELFYGGIGRGFGNQLDNELIAHVAG